MPSPSPRDTPLRALLVASGVCFVCSLVVAGSVVLLQPRQIENRARERERQARALLADVPGLSELLAGRPDEVLVEAVVVDLASGELRRALDPASHQVRDVARDPDQTQALAPESDLAGIGRRPHRANIVRKRL